MTTRCLLIYNVLPLLSVAADSRRRASVEFLVRVCVRACVRTYVCCLADVLECNLAVSCMLCMCACMCVCLYVFNTESSRVCWMSLWSLLARGCMPLYACCICNSTSTLFCSLAVTDST